MENKSNHELARIIVAGLAFIIVTLISFIGLKSVFGDELTPLWLIIGAVIGGVASSGMGL